MEIDYIIVAIVGMLALLVIIFTIRKNSKEEKKLEETINEEEIKPDIHRD